VSALAFVVRLTLTKVERSVYLNPIRDIFEDTGWIDGETRRGSRVAIAGIDVKTMMGRIRDPAVYWTTRELEIWLIILKRLRLVRELHPPIYDDEILLVEAAPTETPPAPSTTHSCRRRHGGRMGHQHLGRALQLGPLQKRGDERIGGVVLHRHEKRTSECLVTCR
jgi:hypothetical protein